MSNQHKSITGKLRGMMTTCQETTMLIVKKQETRLNWYEKLKMYFHVYLVCKFCRLFFKQSNLLQNHLHTISHQHQHADYKLSEEEKARLKALLSNELEGH